VHHQTRIIQLKAVEKIRPQKKKKKYSSQDRNKGIITVLVMLCYAIAPRHYKFVKVGLLHGCGIQ
jgi:hypothetical protein